MLFSRPAAARLVVTASLIAAACGGAAPPATQPPGPRAQAAPPAPDRGAAGIAAAARAAEEPIPTGAIAGVVRAAGPGSPISRARVTAVTNVLEEARVALTRLDGTYVFEKLPPGEYVVQASASGYAAQYYRQRPSSPPPPLPLADGQRVEGIDIQLPPAGVIVGRVLDEDNRPFVGASVDALASRTQNNQPTLVSMANTVTDDRGEFRLAGLPEGQYYVSAFDPAFADVGDETGPLRYTATYYPGVVFVEEARRVSVTPGVEPDVKIVFALKIVRPARVSGVLATPDKRQLTSGGVIMSPIHGEGLAAVPSDDVRIDPDGTFTFRNVPPGRYQIRARAETDPDSVALFATFRLVVSGRDIDNVGLVLLPGALLSGRVIHDARETAGPFSYSGMRVRAPFADGTSFGDSLTGDVRADGTYRIRGLMSGAHHITVDGLEYPWVLEQVLWRGQDLTDVAFEVDSGQVLDDVQVTVTDVANEVSGVVRDARGRPVPEALVLVIPLAPQFWTPTSRRFAMLRADHSGRYRVRGLPAGVYRAVASLELDETEVYRKDLLQTFVAQGTPLTLDQPRAHALDLTLFSLARLRRTSGD